MFKLLSVCAKTIPSVWYTIELIVYVRDSYINIPSWLQFIIIYVTPFSIIVGGLLYFFIFKDSLIRQKAKESDEDESRLYTLKIQGLRAIRKYAPIAVIGILGTLLFYFYKPHIITLSIKAGVLYAWFCLGEVLRLINVGSKENKRNNIALKEKGKA